MTTINNTPAVNATVQPAMQSIYIRGRRWFQKSYGNTYFSATAYVDGKEVAHVAFEYGYGNHYEHHMMNLLEKAGYTPERESSEAPWRYAERKGLQYNADAKDVDRKKDL